MFDGFGPGTGFAGGMAMGQLTQGLLQGAGSYSEWAGAAMEVATSVQASYRHHLEDAEEPNTRQLARDLDLLGREAQRLAVIAENRRFGDEEAELMRRLDRLCLRYTNGAPNTEMEPAELLHEELPALVSEIFASLDDDRAVQ
ncbi:MAG: hypothetical protein V5A55_13485 [Halovenus sp.]